MTVSVAGWAGCRMAIGKVASSSACPRNLYTVTLERSWSLHRRGTTNSQLQGLPRPPTCWAQTREDEMEVTLRLAESSRQGEQALGPGISEGGKETTQQLQKPWSQDQESQWGSGCKGAEAPPLGDAFSAHVSALSQCSPESSGDLAEMKILPQ